MQRWRSRPATCGIFRAMDGRSVVLQREVTDDVAERGIKLISDFTDSVTKHKQQLQDVTLMVDQHRKQASSFSMSALMKLSVVTVSTVS